MLNPITTSPVTYAAQTATDTMPKVPTLLQKTAELDEYQRSDGTTATRLDTVKKPVEEPVVDDNEKQFREVLHQFIGQTLFGQMLKSMRETQEKNPFFHGGQSEEIYQSLLDMELTDQLTKSSSRTISEPMYKLMKAPKMK